MLYRVRKLLSSELGAVGLLVAIRLELIVFQGQKQNVYDAKQRRGFAVFTYALIVVE